tara:strand:- start:1814 stop:2422 length:609 start_codon:yes stop_codon:yes gene_type:complete
MFTYNRGCVENFADEKKIEKFENTAIGQWINEMKEKIEKEPLKSGGTYEPSIEKLEENSDFENGKLTFKAGKDNKVELSLNFDTTVDDETTENTLTMELTLVDKEESIYTIDQAPRRFIKCYKDKENDNISYFIIWKFDSSVALSEFDLSKMNKDNIGKFTGEKKLSPYMILKLEYKPSYLLIIFLVVFFIVLAGVIFTLVR